MPCLKAAKICLSNKSIPDANRHEKNINRFTQTREKTCASRHTKPDKAYLAPNRGAYTRCARTQKQHETRTLLSLTTPKNRIQEHTCTLLIVQRDNPKEPEPKP